jgi:hypothetical protein
MKLFLAQRAFNFDVGLSLDPFSDNKPSCSASSAVSTYGGNTICVTRDPSETLSFGVASCLGSSRLLPTERRRREGLREGRQDRIARYSIGKGRYRKRRGTSETPRLEYLGRSRNRAAVPINSNAEGSTRLFSKIHLRQRTFDRRVIEKARERA